MAEAYSKDELDRRMNGAVATLKSELAGLRTGRASAALLDPVKVEAYGNHVPINQVGSIATPEARMITVQVWDKGLAKAVDKAIRDAGLGLNPQMDGQLLRIPLPELNQERRKELSKLAAKYAEAARVAVRNVRRDAMDAFERSYLALALARSSGNVTRAAAIAEVSRQIMTKLLKKHGRE